MKLKEFSYYLKSGSCVPYKLVLPPSCGGAILTFINSRKPREVKFFIMVNLTLKEIHHYLYITIISVLKHLSNKTHFIDNKFKVNFTRFISMFINLLLTWFVR